MPTPSQSPIAIDAADPVARHGAESVLAASARLDPADPFAGAVVRLRARLGRPVDPKPLFDYWLSRSAGNPRGDMRYRWELTHRRGVPMPGYAPDPASWTAWREAERSLLEPDPYKFEERLSTPIVLTENAELLAETDGKVAARLLSEAAPVLRRDFALFVQERDPWQDTFALWCLVRHKQTLELLHPLAVAIATCYAAGIPEGVRFVEGQRFPFHKTPLVSASAQLATALLALGSDLALVAELARFVEESRLSDGGWGDGSERSDVLGTLVAADLMARIDPAFDPAPTRRLLGELQSGDGLWRALGPDAPWLSGEVLALLSMFDHPFAARFRWPFLSAENRDHKTRLPFFAYFADLARLLAALPGLASSEVELGFIDLVGFRAFNNQHGQDAGDAVLAAFARELETIDRARVIRDGGDEFLVLGAPGRGDLRSDLDRFRKDWPSRFRARFGADVPPVAPRIMVGRVRAGDLVRAREELGRAITGLKGTTGPESSAATGVLVDAGDL